jgi:hypothetical protein
VREVDLGNDPLVTDALRSDVGENLFFAACAIPIYLAARSVSRASHTIFMSRNAPRYSNR